LKQEPGGSSAVPCPLGGICAVPKLAVNVDDIDFDVVPLTITPYEYSTGRLWTAPSGTEAEFTVWNPLMRGSRVSVHLVDRLPILYSFTLTYRQGWYLERGKLISIAVKKICVHPRWAHNHSLIFRDETVWQEGARFAECLRQWQDFKRCCRIFSLALPRPFQIHI
jgi:hypothetical protein